MGNWNINIQGVGSHHNTDYPADADKLTKKFVLELSQAGHQIQSATFTHGGAEDVRPSGIPDGPVIPKRDTAK